MGQLFSELRYNWKVIAGFFPPKSKFSFDQVPDLTGTVTIVTGGNTGVGKEIIKVLLEHNAKVYMGARNTERAKTAIAELKEKTGKEAIFLQMDLLDLSSVKKAAEEFLRKEQELHILFLNAGLLWPPIEEVSKDGYDPQFQIHVIAHHYLTELLMPALIAGTETSPDHHARVISTSSCGAYLSPLHWGTFKDGPERRKLDPVTLYNQSKLAVVMIARQAAKRWADKGVISIPCDPGNTHTELQRNMKPGLGRTLLFSGLFDPWYGALTQLYVGTTPEGLRYNGKGRCREEAYDEELCEKLWNWLEEELQPHLK